MPSDEAKVEIGRRVRRWQFGFADDVDRARHDAVQAASGFIESRQLHATERAVFAIRRVDAQR